MENLQRAGSFNFSYCFSFSLLSLSLSFHGRVNGLKEGGRKENRDTVVFDRCVIAGSCHGHGCGLWVLWEWAQELKAMVTMCRVCLEVKEGGGRNQD